MTSAPRPQARMRVGVVGSGPLGVLLAAALARAGHHVVAFSASNDEDLVHAQERLPEAAVRTHEAVARETDLVVLDVAGHDLAALVGDLAAQDVWRPGQMVVHVSSCHGVGVLAPAIRLGALAVALHPALHVAGPVDVEVLYETTVAVTTAPALRPVGEALVIDMGAEPVWVPEQDRQAYAAAVAHATDGISVVLGQASDMLSSTGMTGSRRILASLVVTTLEAALSGGRRSAPVPDLEVLQRTLAAFDGGDADARAVFVALARARTGRALSQGRICGDDVGRLLDLLADGGERQAHHRGTADPG